MSIAARPLTAEGFKPYGDVISLPVGEPGDATRPRRFAAMARLDFQAGAPSLDVLYTPVRPLQMEMLERHRNSSQAFIPLRPVPFVVVVASPSAAGAEDVSEESLEAFVSDGHQGVNLRPGLWHHPLLAVGRPLVTAVLHRSPDVDLDSQVIWLGRRLTIALDPRFA